MPQELKLDGYILKTQDLNEADLLLTFFSQQSGKLRFLAKSAKKMTSKLRGRLQQNSLITVTLTGQGSLPLVITVELQENFSNIIQAQQTMHAVMVMQEVLLKSLPDELPNQALYNSFGISLQQLNNGQETTVVLLRFLYSALEALGFAPQLLSRPASGQVFYNLGEGKFRAEYTSASDQLISAAAHELLLQIAHQQTITSATAATKELLQVFNSFLSYQLERDIKSLDYFIHELTEVAWYNEVMEDFKPQSVKAPAGGDRPSATPALITEQELTPPGGWGKFKQFYSDNKWYFWAIILGVIIIAGLAAYAFWPRQKERTESAKVQIGIDSAETVQAGGEVIYKVKVLNQDASKLVDMHLEMVYDDGVNYVSSSPKAENSSGTNYEIPDLGNGQNAVVIIKALAQGNVNDEKKVVARLRYKFEDFSSPFSVETEHTVKLVAADVVLDLSGPSQVNNNETASYDLYYRNSSSKDIENTRIQFTYPDGFKFASGDPTPSLGQNIWNIGLLKANQSGKISFSGTFQGSPVGQENSFKVELLALDDNSDYFTQSSTSYTTTIATKPLSVEAKMSGSGGNIVAPGGTVSVELTYRNNTQVANSGLQLVAQINSDKIVGGSIKADGGYVQDQTITWNGSSTNTLEQLNPNQSGSVKFTFQVSPNVSDSESLVVKIEPRIKSNQNTSFISGSNLEIKVSGAADLQATVEHVSGSLPPKVGTSSSFKVKLALMSGSNAYDKAQLVGYVPVGVNFDANSIPSAEKGAVKFDSSTGRLTWTVGTLQANAGSSGPARTLEFTVSTTPSSSQVNKPIVLFKSVEFTGTESFTNKSAVLQIDTVGTNNLPNSSQGRVSN